MTDNNTQNMILGNRYQLLHQVGKGGMASVYEAYDQMLERPVAIKVLRTDFAKDPEFRDRFRHEAKAAANLTHPSIVTVHDFGIDNDSIFIVMEFVAGKDLKTRIIENKRFSIADGLPLIIQACNALGYAHRAGIVHCDVKPHNMIVSDDGRLKITDFGIARALSTVETEEKTQVVWGSPQYLSPEQALGAAPSPASDVYSLGVVLYEMFTGRLPFIAKTTEDLITLHKSSNPTAPSEIINEIPPELEKTILKTLSKDPSARYRTADQLSSILSAIYEKHVSETYHIKNENARITLPPIIKEPISAKISYEDYSPNEHNSMPTDWKLIALELLSILLIGGLIPFWLYVWFTIKPLFGS